MSIAAPVDPLGLVLGQLPDARRSGEGYTARCQAHDDRNRSLSVSAGVDRAVVVRCFAGCPPEAILRALGLDPSQILSARPDGHVSSAVVNFRPQRQAPSGTTLAELARGKRLPERFLRAIGLEDAIGRRQVRIPYRDAEGRELFTRTRTTRGGKSLTLHPEGVPLAPYGLDRLDGWRASATRIMVEGESDCWTAWHHGRAALGMPGASSAGSIALEHVAGVDRVYVLQEPDGGGTTFYAGIRGRLTALGWDGEVYAFGLVHEGRRVKDLSDLHLAVNGDGEAFAAALDTALSDAVLVDLEADQPVAWEDDDPSSWPAAARARIAELEGRIAAGGDGASMCSGDCPTGRALRERNGELRAELELYTSGPVALKEARVLATLTRMALDAQRKGRPKIAMLRKEVATQARVSEDIVTRAWNTVRFYQAQDADSAILPFRVADRFENGKDHVDMVVTLGQGEERSTYRDGIMAWARLQRPSSRPTPGGSPWSCPKPEHEGRRVVETRRSNFRCGVEGCAEHWQQPTRDIAYGPAEAVDEPSQVQAPLLGDELVTHVLSHAPHVAAHRPRVYPPQHAADRGRPPVSFVSRDDQAAAAGPRYHGEAADPCVIAGCGLPCGPGDRFLCVDHRNESAAPLSVAGGEE